jgi:hypothetical protein
MSKPTAAITVIRPKIQQALNDNDCVKRFTEIQLYYSHKDKSTISARILIDRVEKAAEKTTWAGDTWKIIEFYIIFQD